MCFAGKVLFVLLGLCVCTASAASIDVLWYGQSSNYDANIASFAAGVSSFDPAGDGSLSWNLTFWKPGDPTPAFTSYDVLVIGSSQAFGNQFNAGRLLAAKSDIEAARGSRTFLSGQDADWHVSAGQQGDNGPGGFLINAVNWAGSGVGMGIVSLPDGWSGSGSEWWSNNDSFLKTELDGFVQYFQEESVVIPIATAGFPVNEGLTTAGLSNWGTAAHLRLLKTIPSYTSINDSGNNPDYAVTLVTTKSAGGCTVGCGTDPGEIPEPSTYGMLMLGSGVLFWLRLRRA